MEKVFLIFSLCSTELCHSGVNISTGWIAQIAHRWACKVPGVQFYTHHEKPINWTVCGLSVAGFPIGVWGSWNAYQTRKLQKHQLQALKHEQHQMVLKHERDIEVLKRQLGALQNNGKWFWQR